MIENSALAIDFSPPSIRNSKKLRISLSPSAAIRVFLYKFFSNTRDQFYEQQIFMCKIIM